MISLRTIVASLSRPRQFILAGSLIALLAVFMPWHAIGIASLGTEHSYNGFGDQNLIIGLLVFTFSITTLLLNFLPVLGVRVPRFRFSDATIFTFLGGESFLLILVLMIMHATSIVRAVNYDLRLGINLALIGSALIFLGGYLLRAEEKQTQIGHHEPLVRSPRVRHFESNHSHSTHSSHSHEGRIATEDGRMKMDI